MFSISQIQNCSQLKTLLKPVVDFAINISVSGQENIPISKPFVLVSNHRSAIDPLIISSVMQRYVAWIADSFLFNVPLLRDVLEAIGTIPASTRSPKNRSAFHQSGEALHFSQAVGIFPEGHKSIVSGLEHALGHFNPGFAEIALHYGASILPVTIISQKEFVQPISIPKLFCEWFNLPNDVAAMRSPVIYRDVHVRIDPLISVPSLLPSGATGQPSQHRFKTAVGRLVEETHARISENLNAPRLVRA
jgi:1-acyl-sn-glycerol-3-phosphate acyltransferase